MHSRCRTGIGSTDVISAGTAAWTLCPLTHLASSRCSRRSWQEVRQRRQICINLCSTSRKHTHQLGSVIREWFLKLPTMVVVGRFNECVMVGRQFESVKSGRDGCPRLPPLPLTGPSLGMRRDKPLCECASRHPPDLYRTWLLPRNHPHMYRFQMFCV